MLVEDGGRVSRLLTDLVEELQDLDLLLRGLSSLLTGVVVLDSAWLALATKVVKFLVCP